MREIKFRGKRIDNGEWVYGYLVYNPDEICKIYWQPFKEASSNTWHIVDESTVGQFTGLQDKNGKDIYEGDVYNEGFFRLNDHKFGKRPWDSIKDPDSGNDISSVISTLSVIFKPYHLWELQKKIEHNPDCVGVEIIGNIHDN